MKRSLSLFCSSPDLPALPCPDAFRRRQWPAPRRSAIAYFDRVQCVRIPRPLLAQHHDRRWVTRYSGDPGYLAEHVVAARSSGTQPFRTWPALHARRSQVSLSVAERSAPSFFSFLCQARPRTRDSDPPELRFRGSRKSSPARHSASLRTTTMCASDAAAGRARADRRHAMHEHAAHSPGCA